MTRTLSLKVAEGAVFLSCTVLVYFSLRLLLAAPGATSILTALALLGAAIVSYSLRRSGGWLTAVGAICFNALVLMILWGASLQLETGSSALGLWALVVATLVNCLAIASIRMLEGSAPNDFKQPD